MKLFEKLFVKKTRDINSLLEDFGLSESEIRLIEDFSKCKSNDRVRKIMHWGDSGDSSYYPLLKYSILHDPDLNVRFAALKRIHLFKENADIVPMLKGLKNTNNLEPYYSMALSRTGVISAKEFEDKMNSPV